MRLDRNRPARSRRLRGFFASWCFAIAAGPALIASEGILHISVTEGTSPDKIPCRVHLTASDGKPVEVPESKERYFYRDHFVCPGTATLHLAAGRYTYEVEHGPEFRHRTGEVEVRKGQTTRLDVRLERWINLARQGWFSGDTHIHRNLEQIPLHVQAEDLHVAPVLTVWNQRNQWDDRPLPSPLLTEISPTRWIHALSTEDERKGGALLYFNANAPLDLRGDTGEVPSPVKNLKKATSAPTVVVEIEKPFWWDAPTWVATGLTHTIGIANNHQCRSRMYEDEAWGRPRDEKRLPAPQGNGFYSQELYYRFLNCGLRIPPTAGSASGVLPNPIGYNRVYVHLPDTVSYDAWWQGLVSGRSFVTNGPILLVEANGSPPGEVFTASRDEVVNVSLDVRVGGNDPIAAVEVIRDGTTVETIAARTGGWLQPHTLEFRESGWFLVRAITRVEHTFRFASTAPFYVEIDGKRRINAKDVRFFIEWIDERIAAIEGSESKDLAPAAAREAVLAPHRQARQFYERLLEER